jgi:ketosteroid isomerase-like protein
MSDRLQRARDSYTAYATGDRGLIEPLLTDDFVFSSPPDPGIGLDRYWEVCWPNHERVSGFEYVRLIEDGDEVVVTYEATRTDGSKFRNTEVLTFRGEQICRAEVYFGWDL